LLVVLDARIKRGLTCWVGGEGREGRREGGREGGREREGEKCNCMNHDTCRKGGGRMNILHADKATTSSGMALQHINSYETPKIDSHGQDTTHPTAMKLGGAGGEAYIYTKRRERVLEREGTRCICAG
jgi:hypothetical protein